MSRVQKMFHCFALLFFVSHATGQEQQVSPELQQMYRHGREYITAGNFKDAITIFRQAILLVPDDIAPRKELGRAEYLSGKYSDAERTLSVLAGKVDVDAECYQLLAASQAAMKNNKGARNTISRGLERFPQSGLLYNEQGKLHTREHRYEAALNSWLDGIQNEPGYNRNYYEAARVYLGSERVLWGLLYGEMYLNMEQDTTGAEGLKRELFAAYKTLFDGFAMGALTGDHKTGKGAAVNGFEGYVLATYAALTPVVSDGITAENLTMVRVRFLMDWFAAGSEKYPFSLFSYTDEMIRSGYFDIYNQWLFGKAENVAQFTAWNKFHEGAMDSLSNRRKEHQLRPGRNDFYNSRDLSEITKKKKR